MDWIGVLISNNIISIVVTLITAILAYIFGGKKKQNVELKQVEANIDGSITDNVVKNLEVYQRMFKHLEVQIDKLQARIVELEKLLGDVTTEYRELTNEYRDLKDKYEDSLNK